MKRRRWFLLGAAFILGVGISRLSGGDGTWKSLTMGRWVHEKESEKWKVISGQSVVHGPGIIVVVNDAEAWKGGEVDTNRLVVHEVHLLRLVNELFAAGAEAVSINGERVTGVTAIRCVGPAIRINDTNTVPPYEVKAIGDPTVLKSSIMMMGGVVDALSLLGMKVDVKTVKGLRIEPYKGKFSVHYSR